MTSPGDVSRSGFPRTVSGLILAWVSIAILAVIWGIPNEQNDLTDRATTVLADSGLIVRFDGRDATIRGDADHNVLDNAVQRVLNLRGVRRVSVSAVANTPPESLQSDSPETVPATTTPPPITASADLEAPSFRAVYSDGAVELSGVLPGQDLITRVETAARDRFGPNVVSNLAIGNVKAPGFLDKLDGVFAVADGLDPWSFSIDGEAVTFGGMGASAEALEERIAAFDAYVAASNLGDVEVGVEISPDAVAASLTELLAEGANFETGSARLSDDAAVRLSTVTAILLANPSTVVTVVGHTDDEGDAAANQILSEERAQAVVDYLLSGGVGTERLQAIGYGEERPIADNGTAEGRAINRRIEFVVSEGEQS